MEISAEEAAVGFSHQLNTPAGKTITVAREGPTDDGQEIVYDGKGFPSFEGSGRGRLVVSLRVKP